MSTIKQIADRAGVAIATVDRVLHDRGRVSPATKQRILQIAEELNYTPNSIGQGLALRKKKLRLSFFTLDPERLPFFADVLRGARQKAEELAQYGVETAFYTCQLSSLPLDLTAFQTDGVVLPGLPDFCHIQELVEWAHERSVPIVCYNLPLDGGGYLAYVGCDYVQAGKMAAGLCALASNEAGKAGILSEDDGKVPSFQRRMLGFQRELAEHYPKMEVAGIYCAMEDIERHAYQMLWEHPELDVVYLINPGDYSVCRSIQKAAKNPNIRIITNDLTSQVRQLVKDGVISATICQEPERQGSQPLEILFQYLAYKAVPAEKNNYTSLSIHMRQNV